MRTKRWHGIVLCVTAAFGGVALVGTMPVNAAGPSAAPPITTVNGVTWVEVSTPQQLEYIDQNQAAYLGANIELLNNITLAPPAAGTTFNWTPFGSETAPFTGIFNGQGYSIANVVIDDTTDPAVGFFGFTTGTIENVGLVQAQVTGGNVNNLISGLQVGALVGFEYGGSVSNSYATGSVSRTGGNGGGLVGYQTGSISDSYAAVTVSGGGVSGGLVGYQGPGSPITDSYASGSVSGTEDVGGLVGDGSGTTSNSYATGSVAGGIYAGGIIGWCFGTVTDTYATGTVSGTDAGGLVGYSGACTAANDYFDTVTTGQSVGVGQGGALSGVTGESTTAMQNESTYTGWDFANIWGIAPTVNGGFPYLQWQYPPSPPTGQVPEAPYALLLPFAVLAGFAARFRLYRRMSRA
jgi:hypothetical protein